MSERAPPFFSWREKKTTQRLRSSNPAHSTLRSLLIRLNFLLSLTALPLGAPFISFQQLTLHQLFKLTAAWRCFTHSLSFFFFVELELWVVVVVCLPFGGAIAGRPAITHQKNKQHNSLHPTQPLQRQTIQRNFISFVWLAAAKAVNSLSFNWIAH